MHAMLAAAVIIVFSPEPLSAVDCALPNPIVNFRAELEITLRDDALGAVSEPEILVSAER